MPITARQLHTMKAYPVKQKPKPQRYPCSLCKYATVNKDRMLQHIVRTHLGTKPFACTSCDFRTAARSTYKEHLKSHTGTDPFECSMCDFITSQPLVLENHQKIHNCKEQPYGCDLCEFKSSQQNALLAHLKTHKDDKGKCYLCDEEYKTLKSFNEKRKGCRLCRLHTCACFNLTTLHLCSHCRKDCMERWTYRRTTILLTNNTRFFYKYVNGVLTCSICARTFKAKIGYFSHMQSHMRTMKCSMLQDMMDSTSDPSDCR